MISITFSRRTAIVIAVVALLAVPGVAVATHVFNDVSDGNIFAPSIEWAADAGVTSGCGGGNYCPNDPVTRGQMAAFQKNTAILGGAVGAHVVDNGSSPVAAQWFNNINGNAPSVSGDGSYLLTFNGVSLTGKMVFCTVDTNKVATRDAICTASIPSASTVRVRIFDTGDAAQAGDADFFVHVIGWNQGS